jgi:hypothetical protein
MGVCGSFLISEILGYGPSGGISEARDGTRVGAASSVSEKVGGCAIACLGWC